MAEGHADEIALCKPLSKSQRTDCGSNPAKLSNSDKKRTEILLPPPPWRTSLFLLLTSPTTNMLLRGCGPRPRSEVAISTSNRPWGVIYKRLIWFLSTRSCLLFGDGSRPLVLFPSWTLAPLLISYFGGHGSILRPLRRSSTSSCGTCTTLSRQVYFVLTILSNIGTMVSRRWLVVTIQLSTPS